MNTHDAGGDTPHEPQPPKPTAADPGPARDDRPAVPGPAGFPSVPDERPTVPHAAGFRAVSDERPSVPGPAGFRAVSDERPSVPGPAAFPAAPEPVAPDPAAFPAAPDPRPGVAALSLGYQIAAAIAVAAVAVAVCVHLGMVFLHVAPSNTLTKTHGEAIDDWVYPEFEQNWKLFAPNPLQQNIAVQARAQIRTPDGSSRTTGWYDLSAQDGRDIDGNPLPSHTQQNQLRRAWDFFSATHGSDNRAVGVRGDLSEAYLRRIVVLRLERDGAPGADGVVERVQLRSRTTNVPPPDWSEEKISLEPIFRVLPWWTVPAGEADEGVK
ncbi:DUF5819 family protein [Streptomyces sp. NPDC018693]|uniref:DUF5819 family protein n=1 Tax=unclassified Streptomyces TaxID=2593676 RepID=UPI0037A6F2C4